MNESTTATIGANGTATSGTTASKTAAPAHIPWGRVRQGRRNAPFQPVPVRVDLTRDEYDRLAARRDILDGVEVAPVICTKVSAKLTRTFTDRHGLKYLLNDLVSVDVSKQQQTSDWGAEVLTEAQLDYAASDVLHLHPLKAALEARLAREGRSELAQACFDFLPTRARLDLLGWGDERDIFHH